MPPLQMTDARGRFLFANLPPGSYTLRASKSGYSEGAFGSDVENGVTRRPIAIEGGQRSYSSTPRSPWSNPRPSAALSRRGGRADGERVRARGARRDDVRHERVAAGRVTSTDDRGAYRLTGLSPGRYIVMLPSVAASVPASRTGECLRGRARAPHARASRSELPKPDGALAGEPATCSSPARIPRRPAASSARTRRCSIRPDARSLTRCRSCLGPGEQRAGVNFSWAPVAAARCLRAA